MQAKPTFSDATQCPQCGNGDGIYIDAVRMSLGDTSIIWCAEGHVTVIEGDKATVLHTVGL